MGKRWRKPSSRLHRLQRTYVTSFGALSRGQLEALSGSAVCKVGWQCGHLSPRVADEVCSPCLQLRPQKVVSWAFPDRRVPHEPGTVRQCLFAADGLHPRAWEKAVLAPSLLHVGWPDAVRGGMWHVTSFPRGV